MQTSGLGSDGLFPITSRKDPVWGTQCAKHKKETRINTYQKRKADLSLWAPGEERSGGAEEAEEGEGEASEKTAGVFTEAPRPNWRRSFWGWLLREKATRSLLTEQPAGLTLNWVSELKLSQGLCLLYKRWALETSRRGKLLAHHDSFWVIFFGRWYFAVDSNSPSSIPNNSQKGTTLEPGQLSVLWKSFIEADSLPKKLHEVTWDRNRTVSPYLFQNKVTCRRFCQSVEE